MSQSFVNSALIALQTSLNFDALCYSDPTKAREIKLILNAYKAFLMSANWSVAEAKFHGMTLVNDNGGNVAMFAAAV